MSGWDLRTLDTIAQVGVSTLGVLAMILVSRKNKWGFVIGLASQPFWLLTSAINHLWGVLFLNIVYTFTWIYGVHQWFFKRKPTQQNEPKGGG